MIELLFITCYILYVYGDGFSDGKFKLEKTEIH